MTLLLAALCAAAGVAAAPVAGRVAQIDGPLFAQSADGRIRILARDSTVEAGYTLVTGGGTYAQVVFADDSTITLAPDAQLAIDASSAPRLIQGVLRVATGTAAKRGGKRFTLATPTGSIDVDDATFIVRYSPPAATTVASRREPIRLAALMSSGTASDAPMALLPAQDEKPARLALGPIPKGQGLAPGLYVQVLDGLIHLTNPAGTTNFAAGQFGYTASFTQPPVIVPPNPGLKFTPPPAFSAPPSTKTSTGSSTTSNTVDCQVR